MRQAFTGVQIVHGRPRPLAVNLAVKRLKLRLFDSPALGLARLCFSRLGKPTDIAFADSFNGGLRDGCLSAHYFDTIGAARTELEAWGK